MKPFDLTKFNKTIKASLGIQPGWHDPQIWLNTGNYALNKLVSNDFQKGVPLGKVTVFAGESGSGKSYVVSGNLVREAQKRGILPIMMDSEYALDRSWVTALGVDAEKLMRYPVSTVDDCAKMVSDFVKQYEEDYASLPREERQPCLFIIDSLGMLNTPTENDQFAKGEMKGDMGRKAKQLKAFVTQCLKLFGPHDIGLVVTNHTYKSQDMFNPDDVISGGSGFIYASSIVVALNKLKLKTDADGNKTSEVHGIRSKMKVVKSRYAKPFEEVEVQIPYETGMNPYSGLFDLFEKSGVLVKNGNKYEYTDSTGKLHKMFEKEWNRSFDVLDIVMAEVQAKDDGAKVSHGVDETPTELKEDVDAV
jgi:RecA/RadA recombinase